MGQRSKRSCRAEAYLDAMNGVMSNSRGKETYVVIFLRSLAECSNRWGWPEREEVRGKRGGRGIKMEREREWGKGEDTHLEITGVINTI